MLKITSYDNAIVNFVCEECGRLGSIDISDRITEDCVFVVNPECQCGDTGKLYFMYCSTEYKAKELLAEFEALKLK